MSIHKFDQIPLSLGSGGKDQVRSQFGALCFRIRKGKPQILLITSRGSGRWVIPKGWPIDGKTPAGTAELEAWEEAGAEGKVYNLCLGVFSYQKTFERAPSLPCIVSVYGLQVKRLARSFPERGQRRRKWFSTKRASQCVQEPELRQLLASFNPKGMLL